MNNKMRQKQTNKYKEQAADEKLPEGKVVVVVVVGRDEGE